jgi:PIN domain
VRIVMAGLVPAIHVFGLMHTKKTWMPATSAGMTRIVARVERSETREHHSSRTRLPRISLRSIRVTRYGKGRKHRASLNFGDCLSYACAKAHGAKLLFKGDDFAHTDVARA